MPTSHIEHPPLIHTAPPRAKLYALRGDLAPLLDRPSLLPFGAVDHLNPLVTHVKAKRPFVNALPGVPSAIIMDGIPIIIGSCNVISTGCLLGSRDWIT